ncbi:MAG: glycosyltransferase [Treponema sp.]|nr:glycosyltransferase [Treponema sp.]
MKIFLITRGSQGDVYPYLVLANTLSKAGHTITMSLPRIFEKEAITLGIPYVLQNYDDITALLETTTNNRELLTWMQRVTEQQFNEFIPILENHEVLVASNTEFAAPSIAEYCRKPFIRTAYAPLIPGRTIPPPVMPWPKPHPVIRPAFLWSMLNLGVNVLTLGIINRNRKARGMAPIKDQGEYAPAYADNFLMYSRYLGSTDPAWKYKWSIGGYCFNDILPYNEQVYKKLLDFIRKDDKPALFFTFGSCKLKKRDLICAWLLDICHRQGYKFIVGSGWWKTGESLTGKGDFFLLDSFIPHNLVFPLCDGIMHHGGSGTTHSAGRAGKPQVVVPMLIDQHYWGQRISELGIGPDYIRVPRITKDHLEHTVVDLLSNPVYKQNAAALGEKIRSENGVQALCNHIEEITLR